MTLDYSYYGIFHQNGNRLQQFQNLVFINLYDKLNFYFHAEENWTSVKLYEMKTSSEQNRSNSLKNYLNKTWESLYKSKQLYVEAFNISHIVKKKDV